jgi:hypothetical protein
MQARDRGLAHLLSGAWTTPSNTTGQRLAWPTKSMPSLRGRSKPASFVEDVTGTHLMLIQVALNAVLDRTRGMSFDLYRRYLSLFLDGIRAEPHSQSPLPVRALTVEETHAVLRPVRRAVRTRQTETA